MRRRKKAGEGKEGGKAQALFIFSTLSASSPSDALLSLLILLMRGTDDDTNTRPNRSSFLQWQFQSATRRRHRELPGRAA